MRFLEFSHSHYCKAARWALDFNGVDYKRVPLLPGFHFFTVKRHAPRLSVPVLIDSDAVVQGSHRIMEYCNNNFSGERLMPQDPDQAKTVETIARQADKNIGIPLRATIYDRMLHDRAAVLHCFMQRSPAYKRLIFRAFYPGAKHLIRRVYTRSGDYIETAKSRFDQELAKLDHRVDGCRFLVGDRLSRADITVASMLSICLFPPEHTADWPVITDPELNRFRNKYLQRPVFRWARRIYAVFRISPAKPAGRATELQEPGNHAAHSN